MVSVGISEVVGTRGKNIKQLLNGAGDVVTKDKKKKKSSCSMHFLLLRPAFRNPRPLTPVAEARKTYLLLKDDQVKEHLNRPNV